MKIYSKNPRCEVYNEHPFVFKSGMQAPQSILCFDQEKANLFWLLEPRADSTQQPHRRQHPLWHAHTTQSMAPGVTVEVLEQLVESGQW